MSLNLRHFLLVFVLASLACGQALALTEVEVSANRAYGHVVRLVSKGPRLAGSLAEMEAVNYISEEFKSYGLEVWIENFTFENSYITEENRLSVLQPVQMDLTCVPVVYSPSGVARGRLVHLTGEIENENLLRGRVVLVERERLKRWLADLPPLAILVYRDNLPPESEIWKEPPKAPMVSISGSDARQLIELLGGGEVEVELKLTASVEPRTLSNVVALLPGESREAIVVNAHHDSMLTPGAVDDASGVAIVLEMARALSGSRLERTMIFAMFSGEEFGLLGSRNFVMRRENEPIAASITFDCIGRGPDNGLRIGLEDSPRYATTYWLDDYVRSVAGDLGFHSQAEQLMVIHGYTDHVSFIRAGIPATWVYWVNPEYGYGPLGLVHTLGDNLDAIDEIRLKQVAEVGIEVVKRLAGDGMAIPIGRAIFTLVSMGIIVISVGMSSFTHYRRAWSWGRAVRVFLFIAGVVMAAACLLLFL